MLKIISVEVIILDISITINTDLVKDIVNYSLFKINS